MEPFDNAACTRHIIIGRLDPWGIGARGNGKRVRGIMESVDRQATAVHEAT